MLKLKSLQEELTALRIVFDQEIKNGKSFEEVKTVYMQIKEVERLIYERKLMLKRRGDYTTE
jgi:hypothetical protein